MKIVHISTLDKGGGAPLCMFRIHEAIKKLGVESVVLVSNKKYDNSDVYLVARDLYHWSHNRFVRIFQVIGCKLMVWPSLARYYSKLVNKQLHKKEILFTKPLTEYTELYKHPLIQEADIIHLHWVSDFIDYPTFFKNIHKPIVWTVHDLNPGMGGYHYYPTSKQKLYFDRLDKRFLAIKARAIKDANIHFVAISKYMQTYCQTNKVLKKFPAHLIYNGIDDNIYKLLDKQCVRCKFKIDQSQLVFMFSSCFLEDERKGLACLISVLEKLQIPNSLLICVGQYRKEVETNIPIRFMGYVEPDSLILNELYNAADFFILPSYQETFAQTAVEAVMCGTPVVGFPCGIMPELINEENGICCPDYREESLSAAIEIALTKKYNRLKIREDACARFSIEEVAKLYVTLYKSLL